MPDQVGPDLKAAFLDRDGVRLAYVEAGQDAPAGPPLVFVHCWCGDHTTLAPQIAHFAKTRQVVAVDLRGHGASDAPKQDYSVASFADDLAWLCGRLELKKPVFIGHSMGGQVVLELAARHSVLPKAILIVDSVVLPLPDFVAALRQIAESLRGPDYPSAVRAAASGLFLDTDDPERKKALLDKMAKTPQHVGVSSFVDHLIEYDLTAAAKACSVPTAYIASPFPLFEMARDLERFKVACPQLVVATTLGSGHFSPLEVPDQINAMIERFLTVGIGP
jgi:pimeloyl-ACP methyl ester carboxylesterase